jgi:TonB family protein
MRIERLKLHSLTRVMVVTLVCACALVAFPQHPVGSSPVGIHANGLVAVPDGSQSVAVDKQGIYQVGGAVLAPKVIHGPAPKYTYAARRARLEGDCILELVVDVQGRPQDIRVKNGLSKGLDKNALKAVKKYRFKPATMNGKPVAVQIDLDILFRIY